METCKNCQKEVTPNESICSRCLYPLQGTDKEKASFIAKQILQKGDVTDAFEGLKKARIILFGLGAINLIYLSISWFKDADIIGSIFNAILAIFFIGCGFLSFKKPALAFLLPLTITGLYYLLIFIVSPFSLLSGLLWKVIIISGLAYAFASTRKANKALKENKYLASIIGQNKMK